MCLFDKKVIQIIKVPEMKHILLESKIKLLGSSFCHKTRHEATEDVPGEID